MTSQPSNRQSLPGWLVPVTAVAVVAVLATLLLTLRSGRSPADVARGTVENFVSALNSHDVATVKQLSCSAFSATAATTADDLHQAKATVRLQSMKPVAPDHEQAVVLAGSRVLTLDVEQHAGLWMICGQS